MVWHLLICMFIVNRGPLEHNKHGKLLLSIVLASYALVFSIGHLVLKTTTAFQVHFGVLLGVLLGRVYHRFRHVELNSESKKVIYLFFGSGILGFMFWLIDYHHCDWVKTCLFGYSPQGHSLWHLLMGYCAFLSGL